MSNNNQIGVSNTKLSGVHLSDNWNIFIDLHHSFHNSNIDVSYISSFETIQRFWQFFSHLDYLITNLSSDSHLYIFRSSSLPYYDHLSNRGGFRLIIPTPSAFDKLFILLLNISISLIGSTLSNSNMINGIVFSIDSNSTSQISLWIHPNANSDILSYIAFSLVTLAHATMPIYYKKHFKKDIVEVPIIESTPNQGPFCYSSSFLLAFPSTDIACAQMPYEYSSLNWPILHKQQRLPLHERSKSDSWPSMLPSYVKRPSMDDSLLSSLQGSEHISDDQAVISPQSSSNSSSLFSYLQTLLSKFSNYEPIEILSESVPSSILTILSVEYCPFCFRSDSSGKYSKLLVLKCKLLECLHVIHVCCLLDMASNGDVASLPFHQYHSTAFFRVISHHDEDDNLLPRDFPGCRRNCSLDVALTPLISTTPLCHLQWKNTMSTLLDRRTGREYLVVHLDPNEHNVCFRVQRARVIFRFTSHIPSTGSPQNNSLQITSPATSEAYVHDANFDISKCTTSHSLKLAFVDSTTRNTLMIGLRHHHLDPQLFYFHFIKYVICTGGVSSIIPSSISPRQGTSPMLFSASPSQLSPNSGSSSPDITSQILASGALDSPTHSPTLQPMHSPTLPLASLGQPMINYSQPLNASISFQSPGHNQAILMPAPASPLMMQDDSPPLPSSPVMMVISNPSSPVWNVVPENDFFLSPLLNGNTSFLDNVVGRVFMLAKTQSGSRFIQQKLDEGDPVFFSLFFEELKTHVADLMMDGFGHYAIEKLIRFSTPDHIQQLLVYLEPFLNTVACHKQGSFSLQAMMDSIESPEQIQLLANSLSKDTINLILNASSHFVLLRFFQRFSYPYTKFIFDAVENNCLQIACDHHGLRIIKVLIDSSSLDLAQSLIKSIVRVSIKLSENQYGNYVVQHLLDVLPTLNREIVYSKLSGKFVRLSKQKFSSNVVEKCLRSSSSTPVGNTTWLSSILDELIDAAGELIHDRYGNYVLQTAISLCTGKQLTTFLSCVGTSFSSLRDNVKIKWEKILENAAIRTGINERGPKIETKNS